MQAPRFRQLVLALAFSLLPLILPVWAEASVKGGLEIRWVGDRPSPAQPGREFAGQLEVIAPRPGRLENVEIGGMGWTLSAMDAPRSLMMDRGGRRLITFRATPSDPSQPLTVRATFDGIPVETRTRLDAASLQKRRLQFQNASGPVLSGSRPRLGPSKAQRTQDQQIAFMGDFRYTRGDGVVVGADHVQVKIWDDDGPIDEVIWSGETDANGHFEGAVSWDDCDISGCDDPDVYVELTTTGGACDVQDDSILEETYAWESGITDDFTGTFINFGVMNPGVNTDEHAAVHIFNSVTRAHRFAANRGGMNAPMVDVIFPDFDDGASYNAGNEEIHIPPDKMWTEITHTHEFAHHLHNSFGNLLEPDYSEPFCGPSHCLWCPEHVGEGWQEGFANWYATLVVEAYPSDYGQTPWVDSNPDGRYKEDGVRPCHEDSQNYPDGRTEGYVMALLRDIQDGANDNHSADPAPDCSQDAMSLGYDEILTVFRDDDPTDIGMFLNSFRTRYPQHDMDLWSTTLNVGPTFGFPLPDPQVVSQPPSCAAARAGETLAFTVAGNGSLLQYQWRANGSNLLNGGAISGATTPTLTLSPISSILGATYDCLVTTCDGTKSVTSSQTRVTVFDAPESPRPYLTWGENNRAQCGNGTTGFELPPGSYAGLTNVVQAEGGREYSIALRADGTVYTWGQTQFAELGNGFLFGNVYSPAQIAISGAIQVAAGKYHGLALLRNGGVVGWGYNGYGALGTTQMDAYSPSPTGYADCFIAVAAGNYHSLALRSDGTVWASGYGSSGSLGNGTTNAVNTTPTPVTGLTDVIAIRAAGYSSYALKSDGTVWAWGYNADGQLGVGSIQQQNVPVQVPGLTGIRWIEASQSNAYAIGSTGECYAWGRGDMGAIGNGSAAPQYTPAVITGLTNPKKIESGDGGWAMALMQDGTVRAWGTNGNNVLNTGAPNGAPQYTHQPVLGVYAANNIGGGYVTAHIMGHLQGVTAVDDPASGEAPLQLALRVAPTPSRSIAFLAYDLPTAGRVSIAVYDVAGRLVRSIVSETRPAGRHVASWDGRSSSGQPVSPGVYLARLEREGEALTRRIILVR
ncbi:MAG TPA: FlgD immunoglobulin-like domain containing protein [Candidatus Eisenbacteria bacterium]|nr:FlgD immunoglobulin-like domain containing protein [Candidatus Eisenbacteria bacterium]